MDLRPVNGLFGDPAVYAFFPRTGEGLLFDLGALDNLPTRDLLRVRTVCVSHTHIDHFIGFDRLLRVNIPHFRELTVIGPPGIVENVEGKLRGYLWNLLEPGQIRFRVVSLDPSGQPASFRITNDTDFRPEEISAPVGAARPADPPLPAAPGACVATLDDGSRLDAVALDHGSPSIAYACQGPRRFYVKDGALEDLGVTPGPWIRDLQMALADGRDDEEMTVGGSRYTTGDLGQKLFWARAEKPVGYLTDVIFSRSNIERLAPVLRGVETLICETNFRDEHRDRALEKKHLTTKQAALTAAWVGAENLEIFHVSNLYARNPDEVKSEAHRFFETFRGLPQHELETTLEEELSKT